MILWFCDTHDIYIENKLSALRSVLFLFLYWYTPVCIHVCIHTYTQIYKLHILMLEEHYKMCFLRTDVNKLFWLTDFRRKLQIHELVDVWSEFFKCGVSHERVCLCYRSCMTGGRRVSKETSGSGWQILVVWKL